MHNDTPMIEHFKELSIGYLTGNLSEQEALEFARLYNSSSEYVKVFDEVEKTYTAGLVVRYEGVKIINYSIVKARIEKASLLRMPSCGLDISSSGRTGRSDTDELFHSLWRCHGGGFWNGFVPLSKWRLICQNLCQ